MPSATPHINAIGTATPTHDIHTAFIDWVAARLDNSRERGLFERMVKRAGIGHRWSVLPKTAGGGSPVAEGGFYENGMPPTSQRMAIYAQAAPQLAMEAIAALPEAPDPAGITHLVVASCTGFTAPGLDQLIASRLGLSGSVERTLVGFMGCYGAVTALRSAWHIVRSEPEARVLVVATELSTLHLQTGGSIDEFLAMLLFGDGAAAAIVSAEPSGLAIDRQFAATLPESGDLIRWHIGDTGFAMHLSGEVPGRIGEALGTDGFRGAVCGGADPQTVDGWAVHAGGRSILDAVEKALGLGTDALAASRAILAESGNMSSATLMFVLRRLMAGPGIDNGVAIAFGPGLAAEGFGFRSA
ncbi:type III polyketide synthase [Parasphingopyxis marina]|uniref:Type III polyketide synthase n=1 Tax=Parasphingopyxis marina TaxID=2761622 RepID=A0A842HTB6_9SPHN|nr:type III polyketide synthase [Parasphingopyxis marina]MBC2776262.1 type III polyketide synthase [Parasphingopyxis marina]